MSFIKSEDVGIQAVSHSRMKTHEGCPRKAKYKFIDKLKEPANPAMERGLKIHQGLEHWLLWLSGQPHDFDKIDPGPMGGVYHAVREELVRLSTNSKTEGPKYKIEAEKQVAFNRNWEVCDWFSPETWMRVVFDFVATSPCGTHVILGDYKTGKVYDDHDQQADLYAVAGYKMGARAVDVKFYYLDQDIIQPYEYSTKELDDLTVEVEARADKVTSDRLFPTNPSWRCQYCHFRRENGGPCAH